MCGFYVEYVCCMYGLSEGDVVFMVYVWCVCVVYMCEMYLCVVFQLIGVCAMFCGISVFCVFYVWCECFMYVVYMGCICYV